MLDWHSCQMCYPLEIKLFFFIIIKYTEKMTKCMKKDKMHLKCKKKKKILTFSSLPVCLSVCLYMLLLIPYLEAKESIQVTQF